MGSRKHISAEARKEANKSIYIAKLNNNPTSPRKTRLMADAIRGLDVNKALGILQFSHRESAPKLRKLLLSAISNWQNKNEGKRIEDAELFVKPRGLGHRIKKRSNHVTLILGSKVEEKNAETAIINAEN